MAKRDSAFLKNEMSQMNGLMSDIRQDKKYEGELKRRYSVIDNAADAALPKSAPPQSTDESQQQLLDDSQDLTALTAEMADGMPSLKQSQKKDQEILGKAIKEHYNKMKKKPKVEPKNPVYSRHFFENLSLAEKIRLQGNVAQTGKPFG